MPRGKPRNWFNITPQTLQPHAHPGTCGVYGSRYMSGRHEEMSNARDCQDDAPFTYAVFDGRAEPPRAQHHD
jgi:hypothetical protein